jgi:hypothetical protein
MHSSAPSLPMTLGNMRAQGVRSLSVSCWLCHHGAVLAVERWPDDVPVLAFGPRMVCTGCGIVGAGAAELAGPVGAAELNRKTLAMTDKPPKDQSAPSDATSKSFARLKIPANCKVVLPPPGDVEVFVGAEAFSRMKKPRAQ